MKNESNAYLTFSLGQEKFAIAVDYVQEIVEFGQVTKIPNVPPYMLGIINLRGRVLPLLDTKLKLGLNATVITPRTRIMILNVEAGSEKSVQVGAVVDVAREVLDIKKSSIEPSPEFENQNLAAPITGVVNHHGDITMIMDIVSVFSKSEIGELNSTLNQSKNPKYAN